MKEFKFTVDSALLSELGERLVETVQLSLIELVKNAYDADATEVSIKFCKNEDGRFEIQIKDNGVGMTLKDVQRYWMRIATTNKLKNNVSSVFGRPKSGSKGIGRFCCRRLGSSLRLISIAKNEKEQYEETDVAFPWEKFIAGTDVSAITCLGERKIVVKKEVGTTLIISGGREEEWTKRGYNYLKRQLVVLTANRGVKRSGYKDDLGFNIILDVPGFEEGIIDLREKLISSGWGTLEGHINKRGKAVFKMTSIGLKDKKFKSQRIYSHLYGVKFKIGILVDDRKQMRDTSILSKTNLKEILDDWGGVQIRYKGMRVYPYGDDDWLEIDKDRGLRKGKTKDKEVFKFAESLGKIDAGRALLPLLSMKSHVGAVDIDNSRTNVFMMKSNREGFVENDAMRELKQFVRSGVDWATIYREYFLSIERKIATHKARESFEEAIGREVTSDELVDNAVEYIQEEVKNLSSFVPAEEKKDVKQKFQTAIKAILSKEKSDKEEMQHLRLVASTSTLTMLFSHEVKSLLGGLDGNIADLEHIAAKVKGKDSKVIKGIIQSLDETKTRFSELLKLTSLIGIDSKDAPLRKLALADKLKKSIDCFKLIVKSYNISIDCSRVPNNLVVGPILEAELYAVILNILSNSIKSVIAEGKQKKISIEAIRSDKKSTIYIKDTGVGIEEGRYSQVFIPFVSDPGGKLYVELEKHLNPQDKYIVGTGSGLGLSIIKEIIQSRKGSIKFCKPEKGWNSKLEIILP